MVGKVKFKNWGENKYKLNKKKSKQRKKNQNGSKMATENTKKIEMKII